MRKYDLCLADQQTLLHIAKTTVECCVKNLATPDFNIASEILREMRGAFVTLHSQGELRGCIGHIIAAKPLYLTIMEVAEAAALRDPRFPPVRPDELPALSFEISVLSPLRPIKDIQEIQVGTHGLLVKNNFYRGLLLPQVATEAGWNREQFLAHTCRKAGLPQNAWKNPETTIEVFSAFVFGEENAAAKEH